MGALQRRHRHLAAPAVHAVQHDVGLEGSSGAGEDAAGEGAEEAQEAAVQVRSAWAVGGWAQGMHGRHAGRHAWRSPRWVPCSAVTATMLLLPCMRCSMVWGWRAAAQIDLCDFNSWGHRRRRRRR